MNATLATDVYAAGNVIVSGQLTVPAGTTLDVGGAITLQAGSTLDVAGTVTAVGGCTDNGSTITGGGTHPCATPASRTWVGGDAEDPTGWLNANNWSPAGVPGPVDNVVIPPTANQPVIGVSRSVNSLTVQSGATVNTGIGILAATGDIIVDGMIVGTVDASGTNGTELRGSFTHFRNTASRVLSGDLSTTGELQVQATLTVGPNTITVGSRMTTFGLSGLLNMNDPSSLVRVTDRAYFSGDQTGFLTAGVLEVGGELRSNGDAMRASGTHLTRLNGTNQVIDLYFGGAPPTTPGSPQHLEIAAGSFATLSSDAPVNGNVVVLGGLFVPANSTMSIAGTLTLEAGSVLNVVGTVTATGGCTNNGGTISGSGSQPC